MRMVRRRRRRRVANYDDDERPCAWCGIKGQLLDDPHAAHLVSLNIIEPHGALCEICYDERRQPPQYEYLAMVLRRPIKKLREVTDLIAEFAYKQCGDFARYKHNVTQRDIA